MPTIYSLTSLFISSRIVEVHIFLKIVELETGPFKVHICRGSIGQPVANYQNSYLEPRLRDIKQGTGRHWNSMINKQFSLATISKRASF